MKKELPVDAYGIRFLPVRGNNVPYDLFTLLGLYSIWRSRMDIRNAEPQARSVNAYFVEQITKLREVLEHRGASDEMICMLDTLKQLKVHK